MGHPVKLNRKLNRIFISTIVELAPWGAHSPNRKVVWRHTVSFAKLKALSIFATQSEGWAHTGHTGNRITGRMRHYSTSGVTSAQIPGLTLKGHPVCTLERLRAQGTRANRELLPPPPLSLSLELVALLRRDACLHASQQHEESNEASIIKEIHMHMKKMTKARLCELIPAARAPYPQNSHLNSYL